MELLNCYKIKKSFANQEVLKKVDLSIKVGDRIGLVGKNGAGKTTLANIILGKLTPDEGNITQYRDNIKIGHLAQSTAYTTNIFNDIYNQGVNEVNNFLKTSSYLGLDDLQSWNQNRVNNLSGGEKTKLALAKVYATKPDILLLDEPTNHLDAKGRDWLIQELKNYKGAILVISHDRYFLDQTVERIIELEDGKVLEYQGNYSDYRCKKKKRYEEKMHQYSVLKKKEAKIEEKIKQLNNWSNKAHRESRQAAIESGNKKGGKEFNRVKAKKMDKQVKSKLKRLEQMKEEGIKKPKEEPKINFNFTDPNKHGKRLIEARNISKSYNDKILFQNSSFIIQHGERIALIGPNGCGKTTLFKIILNQEITDQGEVWISPSAKIGYLSQELSSLDLEKSPLENMDSVQGFYTAKARTLLANLDIDELLLEKPTKELSMGQRTKIKLADLILQKIDILILDEPTNHLDLYSREELEGALTDYQGTILFVSHDRYFLNKISKQLLIFKNNKIKKVQLGLEEYKKQQEQNDSLDRRNDLKLIENEIAAVLGRLSESTKDDSQYEKLEMQFEELLKKKRKLQQKQ